MTEMPKRSLESHPLYPLYKFVNGEQWRNHNRLESSDFKDINEADFQVFLQDEARERLLGVISADLGRRLPSSGLPKPVIYDRKIRKIYEKEWKDLMIEARISPLSSSEMFKKLDSLYEIWRGAGKVVIEHVFSKN